jgi:hypothetical protein
MPKRQFEPCIPSRGTAVPIGPDWIHEIKHDGYRLIVQHQDKVARLYTRNSHDWTDRYPWIVEAALQNRTKRFMLDGEAGILGVNGNSNFDELLLSLIGRFGISWSPPVSVAPNILHIIAHTNVKFMVFKFQKLKPHKIAKIRSRWNMRPRELDRLV